MQKPNGYDNARVAGEFTPVTLGGHYAVIKQVSETKTKTNKDMIVVLWDFVGPDPQEGYFKKEFENDTRDGKKWPFTGTKYIMVNDYNDPKKTSRAFKTFCAMFEKSNGCEVQWDIADWGKQFKGKRIGVIYGQEEYEWDGRTGMRNTPFYFCQFDKAGDSGIPEPKHLRRKTSSAPAAPTSQNNDWMTIPDEADEEIPF